jgi:hypothetical protein
MRGVLYKNALPHVVHTIQDTLCSMQWSALNLYIYIWFPQDCAKGP